METAFDPYDILYDNGQKSPNSDGLLFLNEIMLGDFNNDSSSISPVSNTIDHTGINIQYFMSILSNALFFENLETDFDAINFEKLLNDLLSSDPTMINEQSIDLSSTAFEPEPTTREMGTDPMEPTPSTRPLIIRTTNANQLSNPPIFFIQTTNNTSIGNSLPIQSAPSTILPNEYYNLQLDSSSLTTNDYQMEEALPLTPSTLSESPDEGNSPDSFHENAYSKLLTNFDVTLKNLFPSICIKILFLEFTSNWFTCFN